MDFTIELGLAGWGLLIIGAVVLGGMVQLIGAAEWGYEWIVTAGAAFVGGLVASEFVVGWRTFEPLIDQLAIIPAALGGLVVGLVAAVATRLLTGGTYLRSASI